jgi:hypothetical protein
MGTRNLTIVKIDGKYPVANYGQWDGYPNGQGATILKFLKEELTPQFIFEKLSKVVEINADKRNEVLKKIGSKDGWMTDEQNKQWKQYFPYVDRDIGGEILSLINKCEHPIMMLQNDINFAADSLFCEWAYVVDFDRQTFEVYVGFNTTPLTDNDRFFFLQDELTATKNRDGETYYPVKLAKSYKLNNLPTEEQFVADFKEEEEANG